MATSSDGFAGIAHAHLEALARALDDAPGWVPVVGRWGDVLGRRLREGARLLTCGNGGSAAHAQHLATELVGHFEEERPAWSAIALSADGPLVTALGNDYGADLLFSRQVEAHGRPGDVLLLLSTSGRSANLLQAVDAGRRGGLDTWALTGPAPNPLASAVDEALAVDTPHRATVQEVHQVVVHLLCTAIERS